MCGNFYVNRTKVCLRYWTAGSLALTQRCLVGFPRPRQPSKVPRSRTWARTPIRRATIHPTRKSERDFGAYGTRYLYQSSDLTPRRMCLFRSRGCSPTGSSHRGYSCGSCDVVSPTRPALRKHIADSHPTMIELDGGEARRCPATGCDFATGSRCEMETHVAAHVAQGMSPTGKKRSLALQRVRYRYLKFLFRTRYTSHP